LTLVVVPVIYQIMENHQQVSKGEKVDYEAEMVADYDHRVKQFSQTLKMVQHITKNASKF
jgi:hypothetical protein